MNNVSEYRIPSTIFHSTELGRKEKLLFAYFYTYFLQHKKGCTTTNVQLSYIIGSDNTRVSKAIKKLREQGYITTEYKNKTPIDTNPKQVGVATYFKDDKKEFHNIERKVFISKDYIKNKRRRRK